MTTTDDASITGSVPGWAVLLAVVVCVTVITMAATAIVVSGHGDAATLERVMGPVVSAATGLLVLLRVEKVHKVVNGASARREAEAAATIADKDQTIKELSVKP